MTTIAEPHAPVSPSGHADATAATTATKTVTGALQADVDLEAYDEEQVRLMEERCILVDDQDVAYGEGSKKRCHLMSNIRQGLLHRAFSVFLFRPTDGALLLQKRADEKITFPSMWTNTCCSHPLSTSLEREEKGELGVRRAAIRKLPHELGVPEGALEEGDFTYLTKIHYLAPCDEDDEDGIWGEHEVDYILFATKDVSLDPNPNEVSDARYVTEKELRQMFEDKANLFTPWFKLICNHLLFPWWKLMLDRSAEQGLGRVDAKVLEDQREEGIRKLT